MSKSKSLRLFEDLQSGEEHDSSPVLSLKTCDILMVQARSPSTRGSFSNFLCHITQGMWHSPASSLMSPRPSSGGRGGEDFAEIFDFRHVEDLTVFSCFGSVDPQQSKTYPPERVS
jgi:hypothetical protein